MALRSGLSACAPVLRASRDPHHLPGRRADQPLVELLRRDGQEDLLVDVNEANGLILQFRRLGNWDTDLDQLSLSTTDLRSIEVLDPAVPIPPQGMYRRYFNGSAVLHGADGSKVVVQEEEAS